MVSPGLRVGQIRRSNSDAARTGDPVKRVRILVVDADVFGNGAGQIPNASEGSSADTLASDLSEPALDLVQPRRAGGREVQVITRTCCEPLSDFRVCVGSVIVEDEMDI